MPFLATLLGLPKWAKFAIAGVLAVALAAAAWFTWLAIHDRAVIREHEADITEQVRTKTEAANDAAGKAGADTRNEVEKRNDEARKAADGSNDPLGDALRKLRP